MRWPWVACLLLASLLPLLAEDWTTEDGKTYKNVTVVGQEDDGVRITYDGGVGKIPYYELPVDIQKRFGQDIESLAEKKRAVDRAIEDAVRSAAAAEQMKQPVAAPVPNVTAPSNNVPNGVAPQNVAPNGPASGTSPGAGGSTSSLAERWIRRVRSPDRWPCDGRPRWGKSGKRDRPERRRGRADE